MVGQLGTNKQTKPQRTNKDISVDQAEDQAIHQAVQM